MGNKKSKSPLTPETHAKVLKAFEKFDVDGSKTIDREETLNHWSSNFGKLNTKAMFEDVDMDGNGSIEVNEWVAFWQLVKDSGHTEEEINEELDNILEGGSWVGFEGLKKQVKPTGTAKDL